MSIEGPPVNDGRGADERSAATGEAKEHVAGRLPVVRSEPASADPRGTIPPEGAAGHLDVPMDRRQALKVMAITAAAPTLAACASADDGEPTTVPAPTSNPKAAGTAWDPDLIAPTIPWERSLTADELQSLRALCDVIIPADARSPSASEVGAHDFIDEWVSAPYDGNRADRVLVRGGLAWLDRETVDRFGPEVRFRDLASDRQHQICDDICFVPEAAPGYEAGARFFDRVRDLTSTAFWTTAEGMQDLQYIGNVPLPRWDPPPPEVLRHIGVEL